MWLQVKYTKLLATRLERFSDRGGNVYNFRCPYCGDSKKNQYKCRGYIFPGEDGNLAFTCHNCGVSRNFQWFLKEQDQNLYSEYRFEKLGDKHPNKPQPFVAEEKDGVCLDYLPKVSDIPPGNVAENYLKKRKIPEKCFSNILFTTDFAKSFRHFVDEDKAKRLPEDTRLVFPLTTLNGNIVAVQGRAIQPDKTRFTSITFQKKVFCAFGLDRVEKTEMVYICEGLFDSLLLPNAIAIGGISHRTKLPDHIKTAFVLDNEPRNPEVVRVYQRIINEGHSIVIWPYHCEEELDVNDYIMNGMEPDELLEIVKENTFSGMEAELRFKKWKKV